MTHFAPPGECWCIGPKDGEPLCMCKLNVAANAIAQNASRERFVERRPDLADAFDYVSVHNPERFEECRRYYDHKLRVKESS